VPAAKVLNQGVSGDHDPGAVLLPDPAHSSSPHLETTISGLDPVDGIAVSTMPRRRQQFFPHHQLARRPVGHNLARHDLGRANGRYGTSVQRYRPALADEHVEDPPRLIDRAVDIASAAATFT
jgi:hypothetical protein